MTSTPAPLTIAPVDLDDAEVQEFIAAHLRDKSPTAPPESQHALDLDGLRDPAVTVWGARIGDRLVGTLALKDLGGGDAELKSMRTDPAFRGRGIAAALLAHARDHAVGTGHHLLLLETGSMEFFAPARRLYARYGFVERGPFADYRPDPLSTYMELRLG